LEEIQTPVDYKSAFNVDTADTVVKRLGITPQDLDWYINQPERNHRDYETYKKTFRRLKPFLWLMYKLNRIPKSFYIKYTAKDEG
jgi:hypothetical protein